MLSGVSQLTEQRYQIEDTLDLCVSTEVIQQEIPCYLVENDDKSWVRIQRLDPAGYRSLELEKIPGQFFLSYSASP